MAAACNDRATVVAQRIALEVPEGTEGGWGMAAVLGLGEGGVLRGQRACQGTEGRGGRGCHGDVLHDRPAKNFMLFCIFFSST